MGMDRGQTANHGRAPRQYSAERRLRQQNGEAPAADARHTGAAPAGGLSSRSDPGSSDPALARDVQIMKDELRALSHLVRSHFEPEEVADKGAVEEDPIFADFKRQKGEMDLLKMELRALANSIQETKREIARLRSDDSDNDRLIAVASELDAVVDAAEGATEGILESAEKIDTIAQTLRAAGTDTYTTHLAEEITESVMSIFEHCNFQDITGQRITKVVNTLKFVEERVDRMMEIWGRDAFMDLSDGDDGHMHDDDQRLLNGPQLAAKAISQDEIDRLFD